MKRTFTLLLTIALCILPLGAIPQGNAETWTDINSLPYTVSAPGHYHLTADMTTDTEFGLKIIANNTHIDGRNYKVTSLFGSSYQITIGNYTDLVYNNIEIENWNGDGDDLCNEGIEVFATNDLYNSIIKNCVFTDFTMDGIYLLTSNNVTITGCRFIANFPDYGNGIYIEQNFINSAIYNNYFSVYDSIVCYSDAYSYTGSVLNVAPQPGSRPLGAGMSDHIGGNYYALTNGTGISQTGPDVDGDGFIDTALEWSNGDGTKMTDYFPYSLTYYSVQTELWGSIIWFAVYLLMTVGLGFIFYLLARTKWAFFLGIFGGMIILYVMIPSMSSNLWAFILIGVSLAIAIFAGEHMGGTET